jgi:hypothetical protein
LEWPTRRSGDIPLVTLGGLDRSDSQNSSWKQQESPATELSRPINKYT